MFTLSILGESPPPPPRACFGRDELIERIVKLAENLHPVALIGVGGIGKTSIALTVLHHDRMKKRFGNNRRFIRCDQFTASQANFLNRLSKAVGAGIENPEDLIPLRPFLSSRDMLIVLDNAESILDPQGVDAQGIFGVVEELSQFSNIWLVITSRITTVPPDCKSLDIPTLSADAAHKTFHRIYNNNERPDLVGKILERLEFHPLSVTLLATVAHQNRWDNIRLAKEWAKRRTGVLQPKHNKSLADTIELSLASPLFKDLGPDARDLLGVIAFFPQGINEDNLDWLFPTTPNLAAVLDTFCILSLTYRHDGFLTMLVPLRDYLRPADPLSSPLLCTAMESYTTKLSYPPGPDAPEFGETRWITSEDANVEHLLNVLTSVNGDYGVWRACAEFLYHLHWRKPRRTVLGPKIEALPDDHPYKLPCLLWLARLMDSTGNFVEQRRLLEYTLKLVREGGDDASVASTLNSLSDANRKTRLYGKGIDQAREASEIFERIGEKRCQGDSLIRLALSLYDDEQLDAAEEAASRAITLLPKEGQEYLVCQSHRVLGDVYHSKGRREEAIHHFKAAIEIATPPNWEYELFWSNFHLAMLFFAEDNSGVAQVYIERAKSHAADNAYHLGRAVILQAAVYYLQHRLLEATSEALRALKVFQTLGAADDQEDCESLLRRIDIENSRSTSGEPDSSSELPETTLNPQPTNSLVSTL